jgi:hypothetical protein
MGKPEDSVEALGVWPKSIITAKGGALAGTRLRILAGKLAPSFNRGDAPQRGPYVNIRYADRAVHNATILLESGLTATVLNLGGTNAGLVRGGDVALNDLRADNARSKAFDTAVWFHDPIAIGVSYSGRAYIMDTMAEVDEHMSVGEPHVFKWGAVIPPTVDGHGLTAHAYCNQILALWGQQIPDTARAARTLSLLPVDDLIELLANAVKARPRSINLPDDTVIDIDQFHAIAATYIIFSGTKAFRHGLALSGPARYALAVGTAVTDHLSPIPAPFAAVRIMASDILWIPHPRTIARCVQFMAEIAGERPPRTVSTPLVESMCAEAKMGRRPITYRTIPAAKITLRLTDLIFAEVAYFQTTSAESGPYLDYVKKCREARAPWVVSPAYPDMEDFRLSQARQWVEYMAPRAPPPRQEPAVDGIQRITYALSPGWIASMIGSTKIAIGDETVLVTPNLTKLNGPPLVIRTPDSDRDDLTEKTKEVARRHFLILFRTKGFPLKHVPHSLQEFEGRSVKLDGDVVIVFAPRAGVLYRFTDTLDVPRSYSRHAQMPPVEERTGGWQDMRCTGDGVRLGAEREIAYLIESFTDREMRRAVALMRNFNDRIEITTRPTLYPEDRAVYRLMCALAYLYPVAVKRAGLVFTITDGPVFWSIVDKHLVMTQPAHYAWNAPISIQINQIRPSSVIGHDESGRRGNIRLPEITDGTAHVARLGRPGGVEDCLADRAAFEPFVRAIAARLGFIPGHPQYNEKFEAIGLTVCKEIKRELIGQLVNKYGATEAVRVIFHPRCPKCGAGTPTIKNATCGHVALCARCLAMDGPCPCPVCAAEGECLDVGPAPQFDSTSDGRHFSATRIPTDLFGWQRQALDRLISFAAPTEVIWLPPGAGKTLIVLMYLRWCLANKCMTKYVLWSTVPVAIPNLQLQCARAGIPTRTVPRNGKLEPGIINIVKNSDLYTITDAATSVGPDLTYVPDEFHTCVSRGAKRASACISICRNSARNIPISGTVFKNSNSPGELATFLSLCVRFQITPKNYLVAVGLMISFRVPSQSVIRRSHKQVVPLRKRVAPLKDEDDNDAMERAMIADALKSVREDEVGVIIGVETVGRAEAVVAELTALGIRAVSQKSQQPLNYGPEKFPDPRGPGLIASGAGPTQAALAIMGSDAAEDGPTGPNPSLSLPQVIVVPIKEGFVTGYDLNRYRLMLIAVVPSSEATRAQLAGRIDRVNNDARFIEYVIYYTPARKTMYDRQESERAKSEALRDAQEGDDNIRRTYDPKERKRRIDEAEAAREKARAKSERARPAGAPPDRLAPVHAACALLGIEYVAVKSALRALSAKARRNISLRWHPDKWSAGTDEEKAYAEKYSKEINNAHDVILQHTA